MVDAISPYDPETCDFDISYELPAKCLQIQRNAGTLYERMLSEERLFRELFGGLEAYADRFGEDQLAVFRRRLYRKYDITMCAKEIGEAGQIVWLDCVNELRTNMLTELRGHLASGK